MLSPSIVEDAAATTEHSKSIDEAWCGSRLVFGWATKYFTMSGRFSIADFPTVRDEDRAVVLSGKLKRAWDDEMRSAESDGRPPSLFSALFSTFGASYVGASLILLGNSACKILGVISVGWLVGFLQDEGEDAAIGVAYAAVLAGATGIAAMLHHSFFWSAWLHGMEFRHGLTALVMRKILRTSVSGLRRAGSGKVVNIVSQDLERL